MLETGLDLPGTAGQVAITNQNSAFDSQQHTLKSPVDRGFEAYVVQKAWEKRK